MASLNASLNEWSKGMTASALRPSRVLLATGLVAALLLSLLVTADASSHREAPLIAEDPLADNTDVYAFVSPDDPSTTTLISNWIPLQNPASGPNFWMFGEDILYEINVDSDGDAVDDVTFEFSFTTTVKDPNTFLYATGQITSLDDEHYNMVQTMQVAVVKDGQRQVLGNDLILPPYNLGPVSTPNYDQLAQSAVYDVGNGISVFAGARDDAFAVDLGAVFDLGQLRPFLPAYQPAPRDAETPLNAIDGFNVHSIAVQVPNSFITESEDQPIIGVYSTTYRRKVKVFAGNTLPGANPVHNGPFVLVSRLGMPLVNEVVVPLKAKDAFNSLPARLDIEVFPTLDAPPLSTEGDIPLITDPILAELITALYGIEVPAPPRNDVVAIFLTGIILPDGTNLNNNVADGGQPSEMIRLNTSIPPTGSDINQQNPMGLLGGENDGFPNGRRLIDDVVDIELQVLAGATPFTPEFQREPNNQLADGVSGNDKPFLNQFPYIPAPFSGYEDPNGNPAPQG
jgi:hypothetical protein